MKDRRTIDKKQATYLYGKNSVSERLRADPRSIRRVFLQKNFSEEGIGRQLSAARIPTEVLSERELSKVKRADRLQGIVAEVEPFRYTPFKEIVSSPDQPTLVVLDNLSDPNNLGSILRLSACFDRIALVIPEHRACRVNDTVMHVASGGENYVPVSMVTNTSQSLREAKEAGYWVAGTVVEGGESLPKASLPFPFCLVLGSEGSGIRPGVEKQLDLKLTLPMHGAELSLNVAMACAIFLYEITRQR